MVIVLNCVPEFPRNQLTFIAGDALNKAFTTLCLLMLSHTGGVYAEALCEKLKDAVLIGQDSNHTYLGAFTPAQDLVSIFNPLGKHGSNFHMNSVWNESSRFGGPLAAYSPYNKLSYTPPKIIKEYRIIAYLTVNEGVIGGISPDQVNMLCWNAY